jgi:hypothetical protein
MTIIKDNITNPCCNCVSDSCRVGDKICQVASDGCIKVAPKAVSFSMIISGDVQNEDLLTIMREIKNFLQEWEKRGLIVDPRMRLAKLGITPLNVLLNI